MQLQMRTGAHHLVQLTKLSSLVFFLGTTQQSRFLVCFSEGVPAQHSPSRWADLYFGLDNDCERKA